VEQAGDRPDALAGVVELDDAAELSGLQSHWKAGE
jgi:hypothetical protein